MDDSSNIPLKRCTRCENEKPQTREFFRPTRGGGYYPYCRACASNRPPEETIPEGFKRCSLCHQEKPMTSQFFKPTNHNRFFPYCRECGSSVEKPSQVQAGFKRCIQCRTEKPATKEFFAFSPISKDGLKRLCRQCSGEAECAEIIPAGYKKCTFCMQIKPETAEYFHRWKGRLRSSCKDCQNAKDRERSHQETLEKQRVRALNAPPEGMKLCPRCKQILPATTEHFYVRRRAKSGLMPECKSCQGKRAKIWRERTIDIRLAKANIYRITHREQLRAKGRAYSKAHLAEKNAAWHRREAKKRLAGGSYTPRQIREQYARQRGKCYYCRRKVKWGSHHIDHTFPISRAGAGDMINDISYLVIACPSCNKSKGDKYPWEWSEGGRLL